jgi:hypothetical protein
LHPLPRAAILTRVPRRGIENRLPDALRRRAIGWGELAQRILVPTCRLRALREPTANPALALADRIAVALDVEVEDLWSLRRPPGRSS